MSTTEKMEVGDDEKDMSQTWDDNIDIPADLDKRITRKLDTHIVPWLFGLWLLAFIDRSNIGNARIDGLADDLHLGELFLEPLKLRILTQLRCKQIQHFPRSILHPLYPVGRPQQPRCQTPKSRILPSRSSDSLGSHIHVYWICQELRRITGRAILPWTCGGRIAGRNACLPSHVLPAPRTGL